MRYREKKESIQDINISPLIDMVFILLIFFMVSTTFVKDMKLDLDRPAASSAVTASTKAIRLYIDSSGETYLDGEPVRVWVIQSRLRDQLKSSLTKLNNSDILDPQSANRLAANYCDLVVEISANLDDVASVENWEMKKTFYQSQLDEQSD